MILLGCATEPAAPPCAPTALRIHTGFPDRREQALVTQQCEQSLRGQVGSCRDFGQTRALHGQLQQRERGGVRNSSGDWRSSPALRRPISLARAGPCKQVAGGNYSDSNAIHLACVELLPDEFRKTLD